MSKLRPPAPPSANPKLGDKQTNRQTDEQTNKQIAKTDKQTNKQINKKNHIKAPCHCWALAVKLDCIFQQLKKDNWLIWSWSSLLVLAKYWWYTHKLHIWL